jgi:hypothetical protein
MKYVKTFEKFNYETTNEGWLWGEGSIWSKIGNWIKDWKDRKLAEGARFATEWAKNNPEKMEELKAKVKPELDKISEEDKKEFLDKLQNFQGSIPAEVLNEGRVADFIVKVIEGFMRFMGLSFIFGPLLSIIAGFIMDYVAPGSGTSYILGGAIALMPSVLMGIFALASIDDPILGDGGGYGGGGIGRSGFTG